MQLCYIHFYQKIARKKVARVNAALNVFLFIKSTKISIAHSDKCTKYFQVRPISGRVDRASATKTVDLGSIPGRVKPKTKKIGIYSFPA